MITVKLGGTVVKNMEPRSQTNLSSLLLAGSVTLGKLLSLSAPHFLRKVGTVKTRLLRVVVLSFKIDSTVPVLIRVLKQLNKC